MELIRKVPENFTKLYKIYLDVFNKCKDLLHTLDCQPGMIDCIYPGTYDLTMRHIIEEL